MTHLGEVDKWLCDIPGEIRNAVRGSQEIENLVEKEYARCGRKIEPRNNSINAYEHVYIRAQSVC